MVNGIDERGVLGRCDAVLSGYQGGEEVGLAILDAVALVKSRNPAAVYCCDPVMGDVGRGFFVRPGIPELMRDTVVPKAQIVTPNQFELEFLTGLSTTTLPEVLAAADALRARGPETVLVTSVVHDDAAPETIDMVAVTGDERVVRDDSTAAAAVHRGRRPDRRHLPGRAAAVRRADGAGPDGRRRLRRAADHRRVRRVGAAARRRPGRDRPPHRPLRGPPPPLTTSASYGNRDLASQWFVP